MGKGSFDPADTVGVERWQEEIRPRVLYVDDDGDARAAFARSLRNAAFDLETASSAAEAIELLAANEYAVVATDLHMPNMGGVELLDHVHRTAPTTSLVLVTGAAALDLPTQLSGARAISCIVHKPWDAAELSKALGRAANLHRRRARRITNHNVGPDSAQIRLLLVEDNPGDARLVGKMLRRGTTGVQYALEHVERLADAIEALHTHRFDLIICDLSLPDGRGIDGVVQLQVSAPSTPVIVMSGLADEEVAVHAVQVGAQDYLVKGEVDARTLHKAIRYATERKAAQEHLSYLAHHDQLTGLPNRVRFREQVVAALARARRHADLHPALLMLDLDRFKLVNDTLGHDVGDKLLVEVTRRLNATLRESSVLARLGGDEFAVLIEDIRREDSAASPAQRLIDTLRMPIHIDEHVLSVTTSVGIALFPDNGETPEVLLRNADSAMYRAKETGRNRYHFFNEDMHKRALRRMQLENDLPKAIAAGDLYLMYQPVSSCFRDEPLSFEVLMRWNHPSFGEVSPDEFVPILEDMRMLNAQCEWLLERALTQAETWQELYDRAIRVAVNISPSQFECPDFVSTVQRALDNTSIAPSSLELELTERLLMRNQDEAAEKLAALKAMGVRVAIDDFGAGYSQFTYLVRFPVDTLKIDRSLVQSIGTREGNTITTTIIDMAHNLGLEVVAEGVEEMGQLVFLRNSRCEMYQGYLSARPMRAEDSLAWLQERAPLRLAH